MIHPKKSWALIGLALPLFLLGCLKPAEDTVGSDLPTSDAKGVLDAEHGGARITLPEIDFSILGKVGLDTVISDTAVRAYFELTISGSNMTDMFFHFPLRKKGGQSFEIKGIPAGAKRVFYGRLLTRDFVLSQEGTTVAAIKAGAFSDIQLYLKKAAGSANICIVIEGQKLPACATDSLPPVDTLPPPPDTTALSSCWYISSDSVSGQMTLFPEYMGGFKGEIVTTSGLHLPITTWAMLGDTLSVIVVRASGDKKWQLIGQVTFGMLWSATGMGQPKESPFLVYGKAINCGDTISVPPIDTVPPPKDTLKAGSIPLPISSVGEVTVCFEWRFDYGDKCELYGFSKMGFMAGSITRGYISVADKPGREYSIEYGSTDQSPSSIRIFGTMENSGTSTYDTLDLQGTISSDRTMAKGDYFQLPAEKKGIWTMKSVVCKNWTPRYPDSTCFAH